LELRGRWEILVRRNIGQGIFSSAYLYDALIQEGQIEMFTSVARLAAISLLMLACTTVQSESNMQVIFELGASRVSFDDQAVAGDSINLELGLAVSYKSIIEFGYTSMIDAEASMDNEARIQYEGDITTSGNMFYLRGSIPLTNSIDIFALIGRSKFRLEALSIYGCILFCGDLLTTWTETSYSHEESGLALGVGMGFKTKENRQLIIQYADYNHGREFDFKVFSLGYRWLLDIPI
jgi:hypothetical protein